MDRLGRSASLGVGGVAVVVVKGRYPAGRRCEGRDVLPQGRRGAEVLGLWVGRRRVWGASGAEGGVVVGKAVRTTDRTDDTDQHGPRRKPPFQPCSSVKSVKSVVKTGAAFGGESRPSALPAALREAKGVGWGGNGSLGGAVASGDGDGMSGAVLDRMNGMHRMGRGDSPAEAQGRRGFGAVTGEATGEGCVVGGRRSHSGKRQCEPRIARMTRISRDRDRNLRSSPVHP